MALTSEEIKIKAGFDNTALAQGLRSSKQMVNDFVGSVVTRLGAMFGAYEIARYTKGLFDFAENISLTAKRLEVTTTQAQQLSYAAKLTGTNLDTVASALDRIAKNKEMALGEAGTGSVAEMQLYSKAFEQLGISFQDIRNKSPKELLDEISSAFEKSGGSAKSTAALMQLMGRSAGELIPMLKQLHELSMQAPIVSDHDIQRARDFDEALGGLAVRAKVLSINALSTVFSLKGLKDAMGGLGVFLKNPMAAYANIGANLAMRNNESASADIAASNAHNFIFNPALAAKSSELVQQAMKRMADARAQFNEAGLSGQAKVNALIQRRNELEFQMHHFHMDEVTYADQSVAIAENEVKIKEAAAAADKEKLEINRQLTDHYRQQDKMRDQQRYALTQSRTPFMPTLEQMTGNALFNSNMESQYFHGGRFDMMRGSPFASQAQELMRLQYQYAWNQMHPGANSDEFVATQGKRIDELKSVFSKAGLISPEDAYKELMANTAKTADSITALLQQAQRDGIKVTIPSN